MYCIQPTIFHNLTKNNLTQKSTNNLDFNHGSNFNDFKNDKKRYSSIDLENQIRCLSNSDLCSNTKKFYYKAL